MLATYAMTRDDRLIKRCIELFDWSRWRTGFTAERYPSSPYQLSLTYSMAWISMLRDYAYWRNAPDWVKKRIVGMRCVLENFYSLLDKKCLLRRIPGWSFIDCVPAWRTGDIPDKWKGNLMFIQSLYNAKGTSSIINLMFIQSLLHAADIEDYYGDKEWAKRNRYLARRTAESVVKFFWVEGKGLIADDLDHRHYSEHAQCLALLTGILSKGKEEKCFQELINNKSLYRASIGFSFYLLETFKKFNRGDLILDKMEFWKGLLKQGLKTPIEHRDPSRSDCHGWGAHPLYHFHASLAGIRPLNPGFTSVLIAPTPGRLTKIEGRLPHPKGLIECYLEFDFAKNECKGKIKLPSETKGLFKWNNRDFELTPGKDNLV